MAADSRDVSHGTHARERIRFPHAASITGLHDKLYTRSLAAHLRPEFGYEPHITLARYAEWPRLEAAPEEARDTFGGEFTDVIREVVLLSIGRTGKIGRLASLPLHSA